MKEMKELAGAFRFTFQYVSINTETAHRFPLPQTSFTFQYVSINTSHDDQVAHGDTYLHSNMFLLIPAAGSSQGTWNITFTFQYVSINTVPVFHTWKPERNLHSNMFLLILEAKTQSRSM